jgi:hypothetical protein
MFLGKKTLKKAGQHLKCLAVSKLIASFSIGATMARKRVIWHWSLEGLA